MALYQTIGADTVKAKRFAGAMSSFTNSPVMSVSIIAREFPWNSIGNGTVVDLGGSHGQLCAAIAESAPQLEFVVQELPKMVQSADTSMLPPRIASRIKFMEHDFFTPQPVKAKVYIFRQIFHNWPDAHVVKILRQLIPAMQPGSRVLVSDQLLPEPGQLPLARERFTRCVHTSLSVRILEC